jgi:hypothetical protein
MLCYANWQREFGDYRPRFIWCDYRHSDYRQRSTVIVTTLTLLCMKSDHDALIVTFTLLSSFSTLLFGTSTLRCFCPLNCKCWESHFFDLFAPTSPGMLPRLLPHHLLETLLILLPVVAVLKSPCCSHARHTQVEVGVDPRRFTLCKLLQNCRYRRCLVEVSWLWNTSGKHLKLKLVNF